MTLARFARALVIGLVALALAGCTSSMLTRLAYSNAAFAYSNLAPMLTWMADGYVDLNETQEDWVRARLGRLVEWHRSNELPRYRRVLETALAKAGGPFSADDVAPLYDEVRADYYVVVAQAMPDIAELLVGLDANQLSHLEQRLAEDNRKFESESLKGTADERRRKRVHRVLGHLESWTGSLDRNQRARVDAAFGEVPDFPEEVLAERRFREAEILALLRAKPERAEATAALKHILVDTDKWRRPELVEKLRLRDTRVFELLASLSATFTADQRAAIQDRINGLLRAIDKLTG